MGVALAIGLLVLLFVISGGYHNLKRYNAFAVDGALVLSILVVLLIAAVQSMDMLHRQQ